MDLIYYNMNMIEEYERTIELNKEKKEFEDSEIVFFDIKTKLIHKLSDYNEVLIKSLLNKKPSLLSFGSEHKDIIEWVFSVVKINALVQSECSEWSFKEKDFVMNFKTYFFMSFTDINEHDDLQSPIQVKIIVFRDTLIVISTDKVYFIEYLFSEVVNSGGVGSMRSQSSDFLKSSTVKRYQNIYAKKISVGECLTAFDLFYSITRIIIQRYEKLVLNLINECKNCLKFSLQISYKELADYQIRVSKAERNFIYLKDIIKPKKKSLNKLEQFFHNDKALCLALKAQENKIKNLVKLMKSSRSILENAKVLFRTCSEDTLTRLSFSSGELMRFYSGFTTIIVPLLFICGMWSTNITIPGNDHSTLTPFSFIFGITFVWIFAFVVYFKSIGWF